MSRCISCNEGLFVEKKICFICIENYSCDFEKNNCGLEEHDFINATCICDCNYCNSLYISNKLDYWKKKFGYIVDDRHYYIEKYFCRGCRKNTIETTEKDIGFYNIDNIFIYKAVGLCLNCVVKYFL